MSRMTLWFGLALLAAASSASAQRPVNAETALARAERLTGVDAEGCTRPQRPDEILVCGTPEINREQQLPYADRDAARNPKGEAPRASAAAVRTGSCGVIQDGTPCTGGVNLLAAVPLAFKMVTKLIDPEGEVEPVPVVPKAR